MTKPIGLGEERPTNPLDEVIADPDNLTLDRVLSVAPSAVTDKDLDALILSMRHKRAMFIQAEAAKQDRGEAAPDAAELPEW